MGLSVATSYGRTYTVLFLFILFIYCLDCEACSILVPQPGTERVPLAMKVLTPEPSGNSQFFSVFFFF